MLNQKNRTHFLTGDVESHVDSKVYEGILKTHAKEAIALIDFGLASVTTTENEAIERVQFTECDISPFHKNDITCETSKPFPFKRKESTNRFANQSLAFKELSTLLIHTFSPDETGRRSYPSAGGLYPIEPLVFIFNERIHSDTAFVPGCYHFRPISKKLQLIRKLSFDGFYSDIMHNLIKKENAPSFAILYVAHLGKSIFKYRYRGYRHAVMECGALYQQATMVAQTLGLGTTAWSSFGDYEILQSINLDPGVFLPITMQLFGYRAENNV